MRGGRRSVNLAVVLVLVVVGRLERGGGAPVRSRVLRRRRGGGCHHLTLLGFIGTFGSLPRGRSLDERGGGVHGSFPRDQGHVLVTASFFVFILRRERSERGDDPMDPSRRGTRSHRTGRSLRHRAQHPQRGRRRRRRRLHDGEQAIAGRVHRADGRYAKGIRRRGRVFEDGLGRPRRDFLDHRDAFLVDGFVVVVVVVLFPFAFERRDEGGDALPQQRRRLGPRRRVGDELRGGGGDVR